MLVSHFIPWLSTITDNWHVGETVSREISLSRKSCFALMPHRKVDFSHSQATFDLLCPFVSLLLLPGELRWAKLVMMPQQANVFHQTVLEKTAIRWKPSGQERGHSLQQQFRPKTVYLGHMAEGIRCQESALSNTQRTCFSFFPLPVRCPALGSFEVALQQLNGCHVLGVVDGGSSEAKWTEAAWFSFQKACGWCNWSGQSEDGMIPPYRDILISPALLPSAGLLGNRAVE